MKILRFEQHQTASGRSYRVRVIECPRCKAEVYCSDFTNTCRCGQDFNMTGSLLAPRCQWGEETGESASDILSASDSSLERDPDSFFYDPK